MIDITTSVQGTGYPQIFVKKSFDLGEIAEEVKDSIFEKKLKEEEKRIQPSTQVVLPVSRTNCKLGYKETKKRYLHPEKPLEYDLGKKINILF